MGLFKKRTDPEEMTRLRADIERMSSRLAAADAEKQEFQAQLQRLHADLDHQATRIAATPTPETGSLDELREQLLKLDRRIDEQLAVTAQPAGVDTATVDALRDRVEELSRRFDVPLTDPPPPPEDVTSPTAETDADIGAEIDAVRDEMTRFADRLDQVESRLVSISKELAHQIDELGHEVGERDVGGPAADVVEHLRQAQTELAAEQARYQIAFREELAQLADRLRPR